jgi:hypothetical protein
LSGNRGNHHGAQLQQLFVVRTERRIVDGQPISNLGFSGSFSAYWLFFDTPFQTAKGQLFFFKNVGLFTSQLFQHRDEGSRLPAWQSMKFENKDWSIFRGKDKGPGPGTSPIPRPNLSLRRSSSGPRASGAGWATRVFLE